MIGIATVLGVMGVVASYRLSYLGEQVFHLSRGMLQSHIYLKLSVTGHLTIFLTRTDKHFWSTKPASILLSAFFATQIVATFIAVYGVFMTPIGWKWAALVWGYSLFWFFLSDQIKQWAHKLFSFQSIGLFGIH